MLRPERRPSWSDIRIFSTCPESSRAEQATYLNAITRVGRWSERAGCTGILIYTDNSILDPWLIAQIVIQSTQTLCPLVAVQPVYMSPYGVAKIITSLAYLYGRRVYLNMVAGGFKNDLTALNDQTPHDKRYDRLLEYTTIIQRLLDSPAPVTFEGTYYTVRNLSLKPPLPAGLAPGITISGSSESGLAAARRLGAVAVKYPPPPERCSIHSEVAGCGVRVGLIARETEEKAWKVAHQRFPPDRAGQLTRQLAGKASDSVWHNELSQLGAEFQHEGNVYWLLPFSNYRTNCPYLVGRYSQVGDVLRRYIEAGFSTFILDVPAEEEEFDHIGIAFSQARQSCVSC